MIDVREYLLLVMKKKGLNQADVVKRMNEIEREHGEKKTCVQNFNEYIREGLPFRPKYLVKLEVALELPYGTLVNMVSQPSSKEGKLELERWKKIYRG